MSLMLPRYIEEDFDDPELTKIFNEAEERAAKEKIIKEQQKAEYQKILRRFLKLKSDLIIYTKDFDDATEIMLLVSEGKMTSKSTLNELIKNTKDKHFIMKNTSEELKKCTNFLSTF